MARSSKYVLIMPSSQEMLREKACEKSSLLVHGVMQTLPLDPSESSRMRVATAAWPAWPASHGSPSYLCLIFIRTFLCTSPISSHTGNISFALLIEHFLKKKGTNICCALTF